MRPTYKSDDDAVRERSMATILEQWCGCQYLRIGNDNVPPMSRIDGFFYRDYVRALAELKGSGHPFGEMPEGWITGQRKVTVGEQLRDIFHVPVLFFCQYTCGTIAYVDIGRTPYRPVPNWGRHDRGSSDDIEPGCLFLWTDMKIAHYGVMP